MDWDLFHWTGLTITNHKNIGSNHHHHHYHDHTTRPLSLSFRPQFTVQRLSIIRNHQSLCHYLLSLSLILIEASILSSIAIAYHIRYPLLLPLAIGVGAAKPKSKTVAGVVLLMLIGCALCFMVMADTKPRSPGARCQYQ